MRLLKNNKNWRHGMAQILKHSAIFVKSTIAMTVDFFAVSKSSPVNENALLIVKIDAIGDYTLFRNYLEVIRKSQKYKDYKITLCGNIIWKDLTETFDKQFIDECIWINVKKLRTSIFYRYNILKTISQKGFETTIQPTYSRDFYDGDAIVKASNAKERIGSHGDYANSRPWQKRISDRWYTCLVAASAEPMMEIGRYAEFFHNLGLTSSPAQLPIFAITDEAKGDVKEDAYYILCPGAGRQQRCWPLEYFAEVAKKIYDATGWSGIICGGKDDQEIGHRLINITHAPLRTMAGKTSLPELVTIIRKAQLLIANETAAVHIAAAVGTPVVCILGGGHYGRFMPYKTETQTSRRLPVAVT
jgi:ADP-heptose:LPS heptosyltransferase